MDPWRKCQVEALEAICGAGNGSAVVSMFCGTGKTRVIAQVLKDAVEAIGLCVVVFPRLVLAEQFREKYAATVTDKDNVLFVSSDTDATTCAAAITTALRQMVTKGAGGLVCVTYSSLQLLCECLKAATCEPALVVFDEAHHVVADKVANVIAGHLGSSRRLFFTATPPTTMQTSGGVYGPVLYEYPFSAAVEDGIVQPVRIVVEIGNLVQKVAGAGMEDEDDDEESIEDDDDDEESIEDDDATHLANTYGAIVRAAAATGNGRVICFHRYAEAEGRDGTTSVKDYATTAALEALHVAWSANAAARARFPAPPQLYALRANVTADDRKRILDEFEAAADGQLTILHNCALLAEGVDTASANMAVFVDSKSSPITIVQNIGRVVRKVPGCDRPATILLPVRMDLAAFSKLDAADTEGFSELLFDAASEGRFDKILRVVEALVSSDPAAMAAMLAVPPRFLGSAVRRALVKSGAVVSEPLSEDERVAAAASLPVVTSAMTGEGAISGGADTSAPFVWHNEDGSAGGSWHLVEKAGSVAPYVAPVPPVSFVATAAPDLEGDRSPAWVVEQLIHSVDGIRSAILSCLDGSGRSEERQLKKCRELMQRAGLRGGAWPICRQGIGMTPEMVQETKDAYFLKYQRGLFHGKHRSVQTFYSSVDELLKTMWRNWACIVSSEDKQEKAAQELVQRAVVLRGGKLPRLITLPKTAAEVQERKDALMLQCARICFLRPGQRGSKKVYSKTICVFDAQWKDTWRITVKERAVRTCLDVCRRADIYRSGRIPSKCTQLQHGTTEEKQEYIDGCWLHTQRKNYKNSNTTSASYNTQVFTILFDKWPDWVNDLETLSLETCTAVIAYANDHCNGAMPRSRLCDKLVSSQEHANAEWLAGVRRFANGKSGIKLYPSVEVRLTRQWGDAWKTKPSNESVAREKCLLVIGRAEARGGQLPKALSSDPQQKKDAKYIEHQRRILEGKCPGAVLYPSVKAELDKKWPDWAKRQKQSRQRRRLNGDSAEVAVLTKETTAGAGSGRARPAGPLTAYHQKWKSRTAASFVEAIQAAPDEWRQYHAIAAQQDARDPPECSVFVVLQQWLGKLAASQGSRSHATSVLPPLRVVDLGCGTNGLKHACSDLALDWTCVDAVAADDSVTVGNLGALPDGGTWTGRFSAAVLSRALWATDKATVLAEVFRVLHHGAYLFVVEPVSKYRDAATGANLLPGLLETAGFEVDLPNSWGGGGGTRATPSVYQFLLCKKPALAFL
jgi:superfamily II DNA or RNA helicase